MAYHSGLVPFLTSVLLYITTGPFLLFFFFINEFARLLASLFLYLKYDGKVSLVPVGNDAIWVTSRRDRPSIAVVGCRFKGSLTKESITNIYQNKVRTDLDPNGIPLWDKLEYILTQKCGYACWEKDSSFDIENHIRVLDSNRIFTKSTLLREVICQLAEEINDSKPQWEVVIVPKYKKKEPNEEDSSSFFFLRFHHSYMDGIFALLLLTRYFASNCTYFLDPVNFKIPRWKRALYFLNAFVFAPWTALQIFMDFCFTTFWPVSHSSGEDYIKQNYTFVEDISLDNIREIRKTAGNVTVPGVVESAFILAAGEVLPRERLPEFWTIGELAAMLPYPPNGSPQNRFTGFRFRFSINPNNDDLVNTRDASLSAKMAPYIPLTYVLLKLVGRMPVFMHEPFLGITTTSLICSNIPVSKTPLYLLDDKEIIELIAFPPQLNNTGITICTSAYKNCLKIIASAQPHWLQKEELEEIVSRIPQIIKDWANPQNLMRLSFS